MYKRQVYFYPANDVANAEIMVSTMTDTMFQLDKVSYVTLKGLEFGYTRNNAIRVSNGSHVTIDGVTVAHTSNNAMSVSGTNCVVKNSHVFDTGAGGISISGGDRKTLVSACLLYTSTKKYTEKFPHLDAIYSTTSGGIVVRAEPVKTSLYKLLDGKVDVLDEKTMRRAGHSFHKCR